MIIFTSPNGGTGSSSASVTRRFVNPVEKRTGPKLYEGSREGRLRKRIESVYRFRTAWFRIPPAGSREVAVAG